MISHKEPHMVRHVEKEKEKEKDIRKRNLKMELEKEIKTTLDQVVFGNLRLLIQAIAESDERHLDSHRLPNRFKHLKRCRKK